MKKMVISSLCMKSLDTYTLYTDTKDYLVNSMFQSLFKALSTC